MKNILKKKIILNKDELQAFQQKNFMPSRLVMEDPVGWWQRLTPATRRVCAYLIGLGNRYEIFYPAQSYALSRAAKCTRRTVYSALKRLREDGVVDYKFMYNTASYYKLTPWLYRKEVRQSLEKSIKACSYIPLFIPFVLLTSYYMAQATKMEDFPCKKPTYKSYVYSESICSKKDSLFSKRSNESTKNMGVRSQKTTIDPRAVEWLTPGVRQICKVYPLSKAGALSLTVFPDYVLDACLARSRDHMHSIKLPFKDFYERCISYARQKNAILCWKRYYRLRDAYNFSPEAYKIDYYRPFLAQDPRCAYIPPHMKRSSTASVPLPTHKSPTKGMMKTHRAAQSRRFKEYIETLPSHIRSNPEAHTAAHNAQKRIEQAQTRPPQATTSRAALEADIAHFTKLIANPPAHVQDNAWLLQLAHSSLTSARKKLATLDKEQDNE